MPALDDFDQRGELHQPDGAPDTGRDMR